MPSEPTRRRFLAGVAAVGATGFAGCSVLGSTDHVLHSRPDDGADPLELFGWRPASNAFHYSEADAEARAEELRETGRVESIEIPLVEERPTGESGYKPAYIRQDGTYYRVVVTAEPVTLERWTVWMEPLDELPDGVEYTTAPREGLSESDSEMVDRALGNAISSVLADRDHAAQRAPRRGVVFFDPLSPGESDLVPDPPFEYALVEPESHVAPDEVALRLHVGREAVETTRYLHDLERVAENRKAFVEHVENRHVAASFDPASLSADGRRIVEQSTAITGYKEAAPPSEAFATIQAALGVDDVRLPEDREVASWLRFYEYDGDYYGARFRISDTSLVDVELG